jgi:ABC-2 type transport system ATP-binding protein
METLIEASHLSKSFGQTHAVADLSLQVRAGEIYGLVGPDGAGKTTAIRLLCGALVPDPAGDGQAASIHIAGHDVARHVEQARAQIGYLPQRFSLYEELTVLENIRFFAEVRGLSPAEWRPRSMEILHFVGLDPFVGRQAGFLSGGMKQKLGLAAALVHQPRVLLLDEPTTGVDPVTRQDFWQLIIRLANQWPFWSVRHIWMRPPAAPGLASCAAGTCWSRAPRPSCVCAWKAASWSCAASR